MVRRCAPGRAGAGGGGAPTTRTPGVGAGGGGSWDRGSCDRLVRGANLSVGRLRGWARSLDDPPPPPSPGRFWTGRLAVGGGGGGSRSSRFGNAPPRPFVITPPFAMTCNLLIHLGLQSSLRCLLQPTVIVPHAHWEAYGRGSLPLHNVVSDSAHPHYVSDPLPQSFVGSS